MSSFARLVTNSQHKIVRIVGINSRYEIKIDCCGCFIPKGYLLTTFPFEPEQLDFSWNVEIVTKELRGPGRKVWIPIKPRGFDPYYNLHLFHLKKYGDYYGDCFRRGKNRNIGIGELVFVQDLQRPQIGIMAQNRYSDCSKGLGAEYCLVTGVSNVIPGSALMDVNGNLIGIYYRDDCFIAEYSMRFLLKKFATGNKPSDKSLLITRPMLNCVSKPYRGEWHVYGLENPPSVGGILVQKSFNSQLHPGDVILTIKNGEKEYDVDGISIATILEKCSSTLVVSGYSGAPNLFQPWVREIELATALNPQVNV